MKCNEVLENLTAYLDRELDANTAKEVSRHLESCGFCRKEARIYSQTWDLLGKMPDLEPGIASSVRIHEKIRQLRSENTLRWHWPKIALLAAAACLIIALVTYIVIPQSNQSDVPNTPVTTNNINNREQQVKLEYYKQLLASYQVINDEEYWCSTTKILSPYLSAEKWKSIE